MKTPNSMAVGSSFPRHHHQAYKRRLGGPPRRPSASQMIGHPLQRTLTLACSRCVAVTRLEGTFGFTHPRSASATAASISASLFTSSRSIQHLAGRPGSHRGRVTSRQRLPPVTIDDMVVGPRSFRAAESVPAIEDPESLIDMDDNDMAVDNSHITPMPTANVSESSSGPAAKPSAVQQTMGPRAYQYEMFQESLRRNVIVVVSCLPCDASKPD